MDILDRVLDRTQRLPKAIDLATHAALDYLTVSYFMLLAGFFWGRCSWRVEFPTSSDSAMNQPPCLSGCRH